MYIIKNVQNNRVSGNKESKCFFFESGGGVGLFQINTARVWDCATPNFGIPASRWRRQEESEPLHSV